MRAAVSAIFPAAGPGSADIDDGRTLDSIQLSPRPRSFNPLTESSTRCAVSAAASRSKMATKPAVGAVAVGCETQIRARRLRTRCASPAFHGLRPDALNVDRLNCSGVRSRKASIRSSFSSGGGTGHVDQPTAGGGKA